MFFSSLRTFAVLIWFISININVLSQIIVERSKKFIENSQQKQNFSGFYTLLNAQSLAERFAASWLTTRNTFINKEYIRDLFDARNLEGVTLALMNSGVPVMTRDYFDFQGDF